jgi:predicted transcriptional regulator
MEVSLMQTVKQEVGSLLSRMPDDCSYDDIQYHLYVLQKIKKGLIDANEGNLFTQEEMEKRQREQKDKRY